MVYISCFCVRYLNLNLYFSKCVAYTIFSNVIVFCSKNVGLFYISLLDLYFAVSPWCIYQLKFSSSDQKKKYKNFLNEKPQRHTKISKGNNQQTKRTREISTVSLDRNAIT